MARDTKERSTPVAPTENGRLTTPVNGAPPVEAMRTRGMHRGGGGGGGPPISIKNLRTFSSLKNPVFRLFYVSMTAQMAAMNMQQIAQSLLAYRITGSTAILGVVALAGAIPMLLLSLTGGILADRLDRKRVLLIGQAVSGIIPLVIGLCILGGYLHPSHPDSWWVLVAAGLIQGSVWALAMPSRQALLGDIVSDDELMNAVALNNLGMNLFRLLSPAMAGFFIDAMGFAAVYFIMCGFFVIAILFTQLMPFRRVPGVKVESASRQIVDGIRYVRRDSVVLMILAFTLVTVVLSMPYMMMLPVFTEDILKVGASGMGVLISVSGIGALAGSLVLASLPSKNRGVMLVGGSLVLGLALTGFAFSSSWPLSLFFIIFVGLGQAARMTLSGALIMHYTKDGYLGRVMSIYMMEFGLSSFAVFLTGVMAEVIGVQWSVGGLAILLVALSAGVLLMAPKLRRLA